MVSLTKIADELILDGELGARLNEMVPVPCVPKTNGEIPSIDDAMSDHERLLAILELYDLVEAAADAYGVKIFVITSFKDTCYIEILPQTLMPDIMIFLSFWAEVHYNSM
ncbi:unnamed protein product [Fraxinus pennsylvanica]|uniref:Uncharacterized protein n=1 Tax=Fraxinus pennsylvanica TaxID=56036 RepID=A0AAD1ZJF0_9LAMI|nr:unnamed protein product [Fraxinus pennsylvanica]